MMMRSFVIILAAILLSVDSCSAVMFPRIRCLVSFLRLVFDPFNFDRYPEYYTDESIITLAQAGSYKGAEEIEEYVRFATDTSPFVAESNGIATESQYVGFVREDRMCLFDFFDITTYVLDIERTSSGSTFDLAVLLKLQFSLKERNILSVSVYYQVPYLEYIFGDVLNSNNTRSYVCDIVSNTCSTILSSPVTKEECLTQLESLPAAEGELLWFDGKSQGCRALHAFLATFNAEIHCPHISFEPQVDPLGRTKCQSSDGIMPSQLFTDEDVVAYEEFSARNGLDPETGFMVYD